MGVGGQGKVFYFCVFCSIFERWFSVWLYFLVQLLLWQMLLNRVLSGILVNVVFSLRLYILFMKCMKCSVFFCLGIGFRFVIVMLFICFSMWVKWFGCMFSRVWLSLVCVISVVVCGFWCVSYVVNLVLLSGWVGLVLCWWQLGLFIWCGLKWLVIF